MQEKETFLQEIIEAGGTILANVPALGGFKSVIMTAAQAARLPAAKESVYGELVGLSRDDYVDWVHSQGCVYCCASTKSGSRCRNFILGATGLQPDDWVKQRNEGGYCATHGG